MGKIIIFIVIVAGLVWIYLASKYKEKKEKQAKARKKVDAKLRVDDLINSVHTQMEIIEEDSNLSKVEAQAKLKFHEEELNKLNEFKTKLS